MRTLLRTIVGSLALVAFAAAPAAAKDYSAERFDVQVRVLPGNLLEVVETIVFRFEDGTFSFVYREIPTRRTDGIEIVGATMDGRPFPLGDGVNQAEVSGRSKLKVQWRFEPIEASAHTFGLTYRVRGAVRRSDDGRDELVWQALPTNHDYTIDSATVTFAFPSLAAGTALPDPRFDWHRVDGPTATTPVAGAEAGGELPIGARASGSDIRKNGWVAARFSLPQGQLIMSPPDWQARQASLAALAPYWLGGAGCVLLAGLIVLFGIRQQYHPVPSDIGRLTPSSSIPEPLDPAVAGALVSNGHPSQPHAVAVLFGMAERGLVDVEEQPRGMIGQRHFVLRRRRGATGLAAHEAALLELLFDGKDTATLPSAWRRVGRHFKRFSTPVTERLRAEGLLDADRERVRRRTFGFAIVTLLVAGLSAIVAGLLAFTFGPWPFIVVGAIVLVAVIGLIAGGSTTPLSDMGARRAARWRAYKEGLKDSAEAGGAAFVPKAGDVLAMAVALGLGGLWSKQLKQHPGHAPAWFQGLGDSDPGAMAALVAMGDASHGGAAGGGAAGAAGGGGSGAG